MNPEFDERWKASLAQFLRTIADTQASWEHSKNHRGSDDVESLKAAILRYMLAKCIEN